MSETEKQGGQKTIVAFIAGLLIGGLLVWVFSPSPEQAANQENEQPAAAAQETAPVASPAGAGNGESVAGEEAPALGEEAPTAARTSPESVGVLAVTDSTAGDTVGIMVSVYPSDEGWIVVRDEADGVPGNVLGAARYAVSEGLTPSLVTLLRATQAGGTYRVMFYSESGDRSFSMTDDLPLAEGSVVFTAQ